MFVAETQRTRTEANEHETYASLGGSCNPGVGDRRNRHGADVLRLCVCSLDYQTDMPSSPKVIQEFGDKYRKIRNTLRAIPIYVLNFELCALYGAANHASRM